MHAAVLRATPPPIFIAAITSMRFRRADRWPLPQGHPLRQSHPAQDTCRSVADRVDVRGGVRLRRRPLGAAGFGLGARFGLGGNSIPLRPVANCTSATRASSRPARRSCQFGKHGPVIVLSIGPSQRICRSFIRQAEVTQETARELGNTDF